MRLRNVKMAEVFYEFFDICKEFNVDGSINYLGLALHVQICRFKSVENNSIPTHTS